MAIDPNIGSRIYTIFVKIENGAPVEFNNSPTLWRTDTGERPTDEWLREQDPAYYGWIPTAEPAYDPDTEKVVEVPLIDLVPDDVNGTVTQSWQIVALSAEEVIERNRIKRLEVNAERDRRTEDGFEWNGTLFDARPEDKTRIAGAAQLAFMYLTSGGDSAAFDWNDPGSNTAFGWISANNYVVNMTAPEVIDFAKTAARWERLNVFAARNLKDAPGGIPSDFASNTAYWPDPTNFLT